MSMVIPAIKAEPTTNNTPTAASLAAGHSHYTSVIKQEQLILDDEREHDARTTNAIDMDAFFGNDFQDFPINDKLGTAFEVGLSDLSENISKKSVQPHPFASLSEQQLLEMRDHIVIEMATRDIPNKQPLLIQKVEFNSSIVEKQWEENRVAMDGDLHAGRSAFLNTSHRHGGHLMHLANYRTAKGDYSCPMCRIAVPLNANGKRAKDKKGMCKECIRSYWQHHKDGWTYKWCQGCHKWEHVSCFSPITASKCQDEQIRAAGEKRTRDEKKKGKAAAKKTKKSRSSHEPSIKRAI